MNKIRESASAAWNICKGYLLKAYEFLEELYTDKPVVFYFIGVLVVLAVITIITLVPKKTRITDLYDTSGRIDHDI